MSSVGLLKSLRLCVVLAGSCAAQKMNSGTSTPAERTDVRPAIIQRSAQGTQILTSPGKPAGELSSASFHVASDEEITGMEQTLEQYVVAFESLDLI
jgi:hypothetical protein